MNRFFISRGKYGFFEKNFADFQLFGFPETAIFMGIHSSLLHTVTGVSCFSPLRPFSGFLPVNFLFFLFSVLYLHRFRRRIVHTLSCVSIYRHGKGAFPAPVSDGFQHPVVRPPGLHQICSVRFLLQRLVFAVKAVDLFLQGVVAPGRLRGGLRVLPGLRIGQFRLQGGCVRLRL